MDILDIVYRYTGIVVVNSTRYNLTRSRPYEKTFKKHLTHLFLRDNIQSQQTNRHSKTEEEKMLAYVVLSKMQREPLKNMTRKKQKHY